MVLGRATIYTGMAAMYTRAFEVVEAGGVGVQLEVSERDDAAVAEVEVLAQDDAAVAVVEVLAQGDAAASEYEEGKLSPP